jgi:hypothetical protein
MNQKHFFVLQLHQFIHFIQKKNGRGKKLRHGFARLHFYRKAPGGVRIQRNASHGHKATRQYTHHHRPPARRPAPPPARPPARPLLSISPAGRPRRRRQPPAPASPAAHALCWGAMEAAFDAYFRAADLDRDGRISGQEAVAFFKGSGLPQPVLAQVNIRSPLLTAAPRANSAPCVPRASAICGTRATPTLRLQSRGWLLLQPSCVARDSQLSSGLEAPRFSSLLCSALLIARYGCRCVLVLSHRPSRSTVAAFFSASYLEFDTPTPASIQLRNYVLLARNFAPSISRPR